MSAFDGWEVGDKLIWKRDPGGAIYEIEDMRGGQIRVRWGPGSQHYTYGAQAFEALVKESKIIRYEDPIPCAKCEKNSQLPSDYLCRRCRYG